MPKIRLEIRDIAHHGAASFLRAMHADDLLTTSILNVIRWLYPGPLIESHAPPTRSVTLILRDMSGVAYTTGTELDNDHKEIHFSLQYIASILKNRVDHEILGVMTHEVVHCYQHNGFGTCPGGLIEGVADWVRLNCGLAPPHWKRETQGPWDRGYQHTAYFLEYLEKRFCEGTVRRLNEKLRVQKYHEKPFWEELLGLSVDQLWIEYVKELEEEKATSGSN